MLWILDIHNGEITDRLEDQPNHPLRLQIKMGLFDQFNNHPNGITSNNNLNEKVVVEEEEKTDSNTFIFLKSIYQSMINTCMSQKPLEACGLLSGINGVAHTNLPMTNVLYSPNAFQMDLQQIEFVFEQIKERKEKLVGIYHSHPTTAAYPSSYDIAYSNYPDVAYIIVSLIHPMPVVGCFYIQDQKVTTIPYKIQP